MTSFCDEEEDDDKGAAGLLGEIENALGMGIGTLGTNRWIKFNSLNSKDKNIETNRMCRIFRRAFLLNDVRQCTWKLFGSVRPVLIRSVVANTLASQKLEEAVGGKKKGFKFSARNFRPV